MLLPASTGKQLFDEFLAQSVNDADVFHMMARLPLAERVKIVSKAKHLKDRNELATGVGHWLKGCVRRSELLEEGAARMPPAVVGAIRAPGPDVAAPVTPVQRPRRACSADSPDMLAAKAVGNWRPTPVSATLPVALPRCISSDEPPVDSAGGTVPTATDGACDRSVDDVCRSLLARGDSLSMCEFVTEVTALMSLTARREFTELMPVWRFAYVASVLAEPSPFTVEVRWQRFRERVRALSFRGVVGAGSDAPAQAPPFVHVASFGVPLGIAYGMLDRALTWVNGRRACVPVAVGAMFLSHCGDAMTDAVYHHLFGAARGQGVGGHCDTLAGTVAALVHSACFCAGSSNATLVVSLYRGGDAVEIDDILEARASLKSQGPPHWALCLLAPLESACGYVLRESFGAPCVIDPWAFDASPAPAWWAWMLTAAREDVSAIMPIYARLGAAPQLRRCSSSQSSSQSTIASASPRWVMPHPKLLRVGADSIFTGEAIGGRDARALQAMRDVKAAGGSTLWPVNKVVRAFGLVAWPPLVAAVQQFASCEVFIDDVSGLRASAGSRAAHACGEVRYCVQCERVYGALYSVPHGQCLANIFAGW